MIQVQPFGQLGRFRNDWLNSRFHFSFAEYRDSGAWASEHCGCGTTTRSPPQGFDPHPHREMEIITYVRTGAITHRDSLGNEGRTEAGDVQVMHAGTGIVHAEYNMESTPTTLFQIWMLPDRHGVAPGWGRAISPRNVTIR